jgi:hypothetical protein
MLLPQGFTGVDGAMLYFGELQRGVRLMNLSYQSYSYLSIHICN